MVSNISSTAFISGIMIALMGLSMLIPAVVSLNMGDPDYLIFLDSTMICLFMGVAMSLSTRKKELNFTVRSAFLVTVSTWVFLVLFGALPFIFSRLNLSFTDAFFESMSGLTTTGSTVINELENAPPGILLWRGLLQWLGGIGIVVMALSILPMLRVGGMQIFRAEAFDAPEKVLPSTAQISATLTVLYTGMTIVCAIAYDLAGMSTFDATVHAMTTISTGGFSTHDTSIGYFDSSVVRIISIFFMIMGSLPFLLYIKTIQGHVFALAQDSQVRTFFTFLIFFSITATFAQLQNSSTAEDIWIRPLFTVTSLLTGTGYVDGAYDTWGSLSISLFISVMLVGGCAGSTSCGIKIFRFQILYLTLKKYLNQIIYPHGTFLPQYNGQALHDATVASVMTFLCLYVVLIFLFSFLISLNGYDAILSVSAAVTALSNVGPGLGEIIGPSGTFSNLSDGTKWTLSAAMLIGRLEFFTVLTILTRTFWKT